MKWRPRKPHERMKVVECGPRTWGDHGLDIPHDIETIDFKVTGTAISGLSRFISTAAMIARL